jgi:hypothetical protein
MKSRKFIMTNILLVYVPLIPLAFNALGIKDNVTMTTLAIVGGLAGAYMGANLIDKKLGGGNGQN